MSTGGDTIDTCPLIAVYDLSSRDVGSGFLDFILAAEANRTNTGCSSIHFIVGPTDVFDDGGVDNWRLNSVLLPSLALLPSVASFSVSDSRTEIQALIDGWRERGAAHFYTGWEGAVDADRTANLSVDAIRLEAPDHAKKFVQEWQKEIVGTRRLFTVTIPTHIRGSERQYEAVAELVSMLDSDQWYVVRIGMDGIHDLPSSHPLCSIPIFEAANHNYEIRFALYEAAFLNLVGDNDSATMCNANPDIRFMALNPVPFELRNEAEYRCVLGDVLSVDTLRVAVGDACRAIEKVIPSNLVSGASQTQQSMSLDKAYSLARKLQCAGTAKFPAATGIYKAILKKDPKRAGAWAQLGVISGHLRQFEAAIHFFEQALAINPDMASYHFHVGKILSEMRRTDLSLSFLRRAAALKPDFYDAWHLIARIERRRGNNEAAADAYAAAMDARASQFEIGHAWIDYGDCLNDLGRADEALDAYERGMRRNKLEEAELDSTITMNWPWTYPVYPLAEAQFILSYEESQAQRT